VTAFRQGLKEAGFIEGQNVAIEFHSGVNQSRSPVLVTDLLRRQVALIVGNTPAALAAKAATTTVPIVFAATRSGMASSPTSTGPVATSPV
jgi:putative ABC transport system substrate-binding protein